MPLDGLMARAIALELNNALVPGRVDRIIQPERDQVHIIIRAGGENHRLLLSSNAGSARAHLTYQPIKGPDTPPQFCMSLRKHLSGGRIKAVSQLGYDRVLELAFDSMDDMGDITEKRVIIEMMGRHSNIILVDSGRRIIDCARKITADISRVREVLPGLAYQEPPGQGKLDMTTAGARELCAQLEQRADQTLDKALLSCVSGLSAQAARELSYRLFGDESAQPGAWVKHSESVSGDVKLFFEALEGSFSPVVHMNGALAADVTCFQYQSREKGAQVGYVSASKALDEFYFGRDKAERLKAISAAASQCCKSALERCEKKLALLLARKDETEGREQLRIYGELLTASLHLVKKGEKSADVVDFYSEDLRTVSVPLDETLSPAQNAQRYFKRYQKARTAAEMLVDQLAQAREELDYLTGLSASIENVTDESDVRDITAELVLSGYMRRPQGKQRQHEASQPLEFIAPSGAEVRVGKNNIQNDRLTAAAAGHDLWLHAKDVPGSHVILSQKSDEILDGDLLFAAALAARYSKARSGSKVAVDYTYRRNVKKPSGAKPGFVIYQTNWTVYVDPLKC